MENNKVDKNPQSQSFAIVASKKILETVQGLGTLPKETVKAFADVVKGSCAFAWRAERYVSDNLRNVVPLDQGILQTAKDILFND